MRALKLKPLRKLSLISLLLCGMAVPVHAEGALAVAVADGGYPKGFAYAWKLRATTSAEAQKEALAECHLQAKMNDVPPSRCKVVEVFRNKCIAAAFDPQVRWAGWGVGNNEEAARAIALRKCRERGRACHISDLDCDR